MRILFACLISLTLFTSIARSQDDSSSAASQYPTLLENARTMGEAYKAGEYNKFISFLHPGLVKAVGGNAKMIAIMKKLEEDMKAENLTIKSMSYQEPAEYIKTGKTIQALVPQQTEFTNGQRRLTTYTSYIAISSDQGKTWKFVDANNKTIEQIKTIIPEVSNQLNLPEKKKPAVTRK